MTDKSVKAKAKRQLNKLQNMLKSSSKGKDLGEDGWMPVEYVSDLVKYYNYVVGGKFNKAADLQLEGMDTDTRELIETDIYNHIYEFKYGED